MSKKVAIITITELDNFGNRLQNYALQEILKDLGCSVETIHNFINYKYMRNLKFKAKKIAVGILKKRKNYISEILKKVRFERFDKKYFAFSKDYSTFDYISPNINEHYDYFVAGSDQIWNPYFEFNFDFNFLTFADKEKRIAYSPSIGVDEIPKDNQNEFIYYFNGFKALSVRENSGKEIVKSLTGKDIPVLLDPSLLLTKERWKNFEKKPHFIIVPKKYILVYFLGNKDILQSEINKIKTDDKYKDCKVVDISDEESINCFSVTPDEFVWLVDNAELVITDSFHATAFSLIMDTEFLNIKRDDDFVSMNSRITSLFDMLNIKSEQGQIVNPSKVLNYLLLDEKRNEAINYLKGALDLDET